MTFKRKIGGAVLALALAAGAVPGVISSAFAVDTGQIMDRGRFPRTIHIVLGVTAATIAALVLLTGRDNDRPTSP